MVDECDLEEVNVDGEESYRQRPSILKRDTGETRGFVIDFVRLLCVVSFIKGHWAWMTGPSASELSGIIAPVWTTPSEVRLGYKHQASKWLPFFESVMLCSLWVEREEDMCTREGSLSWRWKLVLPRDRAIENESEQEFLDLRSLLSRPV